MKKVAKVTGLVLVLVIANMLTGCAAPKGDRGDRGPKGFDGYDGNDGIDATPMRIVQLCDGTTVYPTAFVEVGFCLQGEVYATYSANGGFSTKLPPGNYSSNAIGSSCNFTVGLDCKITH